MMVEEQFRDIMHRTMRNFELVDRLRERAPTEGGGPFEVTQLVNSFLGAFALPRERDLSPKLKRISIEEAQERWDLPVLMDDYPNLPRVKHRGTEKPEDLDNLVRLIRNGVLHGNIELRRGIAHDIGGLSICNRCSCDRCRGEPTWGTTLDVVTLRQLLESFVKVADHLYEEATMPNSARSEAAL